MKNIAHNIYIHVPFCMSKCNYCAFFSRACENPDWDQYTCGICNEIKYWGEKLGGIDIPTIFLGGGTPSLMPVATMEKILGEIRNNFNISDGAEITMESNPGTLDTGKLRDFKNAGINRLSVGVQSLDDKKLQFLGRRHSAHDARTLIDTGHDMGLRVSADFIYGLPGDTEQAVAEMCNQINNIGLKHVSMYELTIEKNTPFGRMNLNMPCNEEMAKMYMAIQNNLKLGRYEVSNYCAGGEHCRHNQNVWDGDAYIGIGRGAAGRVFIDNKWFEQMGAGEHFSEIPSETRATEMIITGMRTIRGCRLTETIKNVIDIDWVQKHPELVKIEDNRIRATDMGMMILDEIIVNVIR